MRQIAQARSHDLVLNGNRAQLDKYGVAKLGLFGSFVRNEQRADSDVDLLVEFRPEQKNFDTLCHLSYVLEKLFERPVEELDTFART